MSLGRLLYLIRRDFKRGWAAAYNDYYTTPLIEEWEWPFWSEALHPVPVHVLTGAKDWRLSAWMLASFYHFSDQNWQVTFHDDGTLPAEARGVLSRLFKGARFVARHEADRRMETVLAAYPFCREYRRSHPLALKIFDVPAFCTGPRYILLDSDVLFFDRPQEVVDWAGDAERLECWFNEDVQEGSLVSASEARSELDIRLWGRVNSGLCLVSREAVDLALCDAALAQTSILQGHVWRVEQTLYALCASRFGRGGLLPKTYEVSLGDWAGQGVVARHYVGAVRDRFYAEGLPRLAPTLIDEE